MTNDNHDEMITTMLKTTTVMLSTENEAVNTTNSRNTVGCPQD